MLFFLIRLIISAGALLFISGASGGTIEVKNATAAVLAALLLGFANAIIKPILGFIAGILTLPLSCLTLGLWSLVLSWLLNAFLFYEVGRLLSGFEVHGFWPALWGALGLSVVNSLATALLGGNDKERRPQHRS